MSNAPQTQKPEVQNTPSSNQSKPAQVGNNVTKDEPTAKSGKDAMKNEGGSCSTSSDKKSTQGGCN